MSDSAHHARRGGSHRIGLAYLAATGIVLLAACVAQPPVMPTDPSIPVRESSAPAFSNLDAPPQSSGPSIPPVPTTDPGTFKLGDTVTIHTSIGSTWEITVTEVVDDANAFSSQYEDVPVGQRAVQIKLKIKNVGELTSHPYYDMKLGYRPDAGPLYSQTSGPSYGDRYNDLGYVSSFEPGDTFTGHIVVYVPEKAAKGNAEITGDNGSTAYVWKQ